MKKYILVETEVSKQTPFRHFSNLINLYNPNSIGVDPITPMDQQPLLFKHNRFNRDLYIDNLDGHLYIKSFRENTQLKIDLDTLTELCHSKKSHHQWIGCGYDFSNNLDRSLENLKFWYRDSDSLKVKDCFTNEDINNGSSFIANTVFLLHGMVKDSPVFHMLLNDDVLFEANATMNTDQYYVDTINFHDGTFKEFLLKPGFEKSFVSDNVVIAPAQQFTVDFYSRTALYDKGFPFDTLQLKVKSNLKHHKTGTGKYLFDMEDQQHGYLYARINSSFGLEQEKSTTLRVAYSVYSSR
jgi:hypothetical protein